MRSGFRRWTFFAEVPAFFLPRGNGDDGGRRTGRGPTVSIVVLDAQHFGRVLGRLGLQHLVDDRVVPYAEQRADETGVGRGRGRGRYGRRGRRAGAPGPLLVVAVVFVRAAVFFGYVPHHAVLEREPALARLARERLLFGVGAHVPT